MSVEKLLNAWLTSNKQARNLFDNWQGAVYRSGPNSEAALTLRIAWLEARNRTRRLQHAILAKPSKTQRFRAQ